MTHYIREYGEVYDALAFLSFYFNNSETSGPILNITNNAYFSVLNKWGYEGECNIPDYLRPFCYGRTENTFLYKITFEDRTYTQCTCERLLRTLKNKTFIKRKYVEHFLPDADAVSVRKMIQFEHPASIELLRRAKLPAGIEACFLYALVHFDTIIDTLYHIIEKLCEKIACLHLEFLAQNPTVIEAALNISTAEKLQALAGITVSGDLNVSFSVLTEQHLSICPFEPSSFLLGRNFGETLNTRYRYVAVTPFTFAQAIGNQTKYDIYKALLERSPQSTAELCRCLHLSKNSITYNLNEMLTRGLLLLDHAKGLSHYYRIDPGYIRYVAGFLLGNEIKKIEK